MRNYIRFSVIAYLFLTAAVSLGLYRQGEIIQQHEQDRMHRRAELNAFIYTQCIEDEIRDGIIVQQLQGAITRVKASLPPGDPIREQQIDLLEGGIMTLEPENEPSCVPPKG